MYVLILSVVDTEINKIVLNTCFHGACIQKTTSYMILSHFTFLNCFSLLTKLEHRSKGKDIPFSSNILHFSKNAK
jgi:hypothetical protein